MIVGTGILVVWDGAHEYYVQDYPTTRGAVIDAMRYTETRIISR